MYLDLPIETLHDKQALSDYWFAELASSIHEAGHALAARDLGFQVAWVSIDEDFLKSDPLAIKNERASGCPTTMTLASHLITPIYQRGCVVSRDEWDILRRYFIQCYAGPLAEGHFNRHFQHHVAALDYQQGSGMLWHLMKPNKIRFRQKQKQFIAETLDYVTRNSTTIYWLGFALYQRKTIMGAEIDAAILVARQTAAAKEAA